ncbi:regulator of G-protein signaling loco-like [Oppia nitens]|uniref:regulator of G-protein signaling loco-like n=1 Tax=Oppia nitens TaxID=1686743 RepID=UPI0023DC831A|nr:regulator of G-protein signaling loco-like [Oppia nitens]
MDLTNELSKDIKFLCDWIHDFDKLLNDKTGVKLFSEFLNKEYSIENLKFWMCCQKYKKITDNKKRVEFAKHIYNKYLSAGASDAVNVDSLAIHSVEDNLKDPKQELFAVPEKQIYNLMKYDCYKRFLKSFYNNNMSDNAFHENIVKSAQKCCYSPIIKNLEEVNPITSSRYRQNAFKKLRKLETNNQMNRRIYKQKLLKNLSPKKRLINKNKLICDNSLNSLNHSSTICSPNESHPIKCRQKDMRSTQMQSIQWIQSNISLTPNRNNHNLVAQFSSPALRSLTVMFSDGPKERVKITKSQTLKNLLEILLEKKFLYYTAFEAFPVNSDIALDLNCDVLHMTFNEIRVEQRITFDVKLPNGLVINVKSKPSTICAKVLNPILMEFNPRYDSDYFSIQFCDTNELLAPDVPIFCADNRKLYVTYNGVNETKSLDSKAILNTNNLEDRKLLSQFLNEKNDFIKTTSLKKNRDFLNISDIIFNDENKSEAFFDDLLKSSQTVPNYRNELRLSNNLNVPEEFNDEFNNSFELQTKKYNNEEYKQKSHSNKSPKYKTSNDSTDKKSSTTLMSDQLYDKRHKS